MENVLAITLINQIALPEQSLKKLSFCSSNKVAKVADWANFLRPTQFQQTSAMLYQALPEVNALRCPLQTRFEMLELLRPYVQGCILGLSKEFLQQPIALPPEAQKSAIIAQALQKHMIDGYLLVIKEVLEAKKSKPQELDFFSTALHRAITGLGLVFLRGYQMYAQVPRGMWQNLHILFRIADSFDLLDQRIPDEVQRSVKVSTIQNAYLQVILLASARPHQLSQADIRAIYDAFAEWAEHVRFSLDLSDDPDSFYYVNLELDSGPMYKSRESEDECTHLKIELKLKSLLSQLAKQTGEAAEDMGSSVLTIPKDISLAVLKHLLDVWGNIAQRKQDRRPIQMTAELCVGLSDCHYYLCNELSFEEFTQAVGDDMPNSVSSGFTPRDSFAKSVSAKSKNTLTRVEIQNISPGGYCLLWKSDTPVKVQSGDVVGVKEFGKRVWTIGVVRWIRQKKHSSQLGIQILSEKVKPYGLAQTYDMGGYSDYMRALYIPGSQLSDTPETLIASSVPFQTMDKVKVLDGDNTYDAKLTEQVFAAGSIQQFTFRRSQATQKSDNQGAAKSSW